MAVQVEPRHTRGFVWPLGVLLLAVLPALGVGLGMEWPTVLVTGFGVALFVGIRDWRLPAMGLVLFAPFAGLPVLLSYPDTGFALVLKDTYFVIPAFVGLLSATHLAPMRDVHDRMVTRWIVLFGLVVLLQALNPADLSLLARVVGIKVWFLYVPLFFVGYHLVRRPADVRRITQMMGLVGVPAALVGIAQAVLVYTGNLDFAYRWYGAAAAGATQDFARLALEGGGEIRRVASIFPSVTQYFAFTVGMVVASYIWWRWTRSGSRQSVVAMTVLAIHVMASLTSGARAAFVTIPALLVVATLIEGDRQRVAGWWNAAAPFVGLGAAAALLGGTVSGLYRHAIDIALLQFDDLIVQGFGRALRLTVLGMGTGSQTNAARHVLGEGQLFRMADGQWFESWYVKSWLELGVVGFALATGLLVVLTLQGWRLRRRLRPGPARATLGMIIALLGWLLVAGLKGQYLEVDPLNLYVWLLLGAAWKVGHLDLVSRPQPGFGASVAGESG